MARMNPHLTLNDYVVEARRFNQQRNRLKRDERRLPENSNPLEPKSCPCDSPWEDEDEDGYRFCLKCSRELA